MMIRKNAFIFTRPLQYVNLKGIINKENENERNILYVFPNFKEGEIFAKEIKRHENIWHEVIVVQSKYALLLKLFLLRPNSIYINTDTGFYSMLLLLSGCRNNFVYEEGWGTYNSNHQNIGLRNKFLFKVYQLLGSGNSMGHSKWTKGVFVYKPELYLKLFPRFSKDVLKLMPDFIERLNHEKPLFESIYNFEKDCQYHNQKIIIYATGWTVNQDIINQIRTDKTFSVLMLKLHPHIRSTDFDIQDFVLLEQNVLLELYLIELLKRNNEITVYHENSFSILNFKGLIKIVNVGRRKDDFDSIEKIY